MKKKNIFWAVVDEEGDVENVFSTRTQAREYVDDWADWFENKKKVVKIEYKIVK